MKKVLYLFFGIVVVALGILLIVFWLEEFIDMIKGLLGPMIVLAGIIVFIVGLMTPLKEEDLFAEDLDSCDSVPEEDPDSNKNESDKT